MGGDIMKKITLTLVMALLFAIGASACTGKNASGESSSAGQEYSNSIENEISSNASDETYSNAEESSETGSSDSNSEESNENDSDPEESGETGSAPSNSGNGSSEESSEELWTDMYKL